MRYVALMVLLALLAGPALWALDAARGKAERRATAAELRAGTAEAALKRQAADAALADKLATRLASAENTLAATVKERDDALTKVTTGRTCLRAGALRVLDGAAGLRVAAAPERPASGAAATDGAAAADSSHGGAAGGQLAAAAGIEPAELEATDTAVARWMLAAGAQYETCRARLHTLIDYTLGTTAPATP